MRAFSAYRVLLLGVILILLTASAQAQTNEQKALEAKSEQLQKEISEMNRLLFAERSKKGMF